MVAGNHIITARHGNRNSKLLRRKEVSRMEKIKKFLKDEEGVTAIEYGLIAALIAVAVIATVTLVGNQLKTVFSQVQSGLAGS
jgi:pilus assembly protein Flp/PilA